MINGVRFINTTMETMPAGAVVEPTGLYDSLGYMLVRKVTSDNATHVWFNGPGEVGYGERGECYPAHPSATAGIDPQYDPLAPRQTLGAKAGEWLLNIDRLGFVAIGQPYTDMADVQPTFQAAGDSGFMFAELVGSNATATTPGVGEVDGDQLAYSWITRIEGDEDGVWKDGDISGELNAYLAETSAGASAEPLKVRVGEEAGQLVLIRKRPNADPEAEETWEFVPCADAGADIGNQDHPATGTTDTKPLKKLRVVNPYLEYRNVGDEDDIDTTDQTVEFMGIYLGNTTTEASGSTGTELTKKVKVIPPLRVAHPSEDDEEDDVTTIYWEKEDVPKQRITYVDCVNLKKKNLYSTITLPEELGGQTLPVTHTIVEADVPPYSVPYGTEVWQRTSSVYIPDLGAPTHNQCEVKPPCCPPDDPCGCVCPPESEFTGDSLVIGTNNVTLELVEQVDGEDDSSYRARGTFVFCLPDMTKCYNVRFNTFSYDLPPHTGSEGHFGADISDTLGTATCADYNGLMTGGHDEAGAPSLDIDNDINAKFLDPANDPNGFDLPVSPVDCQKKFLKIGFDFLFYPQSESGKTVTFHIVIAEAAC